MIPKVIIFLILLIPTILFGQSKNCYAYNFSAKTVCTLRPSNIIKDTVISILPKYCNSQIFDSLTNGIWKIYSHDTSTLMEVVAIKNGQRNGIDIIYYSNGQIEKQSYFQEGQLEGKYITFYETGKICFEGYHKKNKFTGTERKYWDNGNLASISKFKNGVCRCFKDEKYWDQSGTKIAPEKFLELWYDCR